MKKLTKYGISFFAFLFLMSCFIDQEEDIVGKWNYMKNGGENSIITEEIEFISTENSSYSFIWSKKIEDINGTAILAHREGTALIENRFSGVEVIPTVHFTWEEEESENSLFLKYRIQGNSLSIASESSVTVYYKVEVENDEN